MGLDRFIQILSSTAHCLFTLLVLDSRPLIIISLFKLTGFLVLACLLAFVVVHSANICRLVITCLHAFPVSFFPLRVDRLWVERSQMAIAVPNEPSLSSLFQRPPPILSL
jgi:hypothetical protein